MSWGFPPIDAGPPGGGPQVSPPDDPVAPLGVPQDPYQDTEPTAPASGSEDGGASALTTGPPEGLPAAPTPAAPSVPSLSVVDVVIVAGGLLVGWAAGELLLGRGTR